MSISNNYYTKQEGDLDIIRSGNIGFAYYSSPLIKNIGDELCSPRHYFEFSSDSENSTLIVGGGAIGDGRTLLANSGYRHRLVWGVGHSTPFISQDASADSRLVPALMGRAVRRVVRLMGGQSPTAIHAAPVVPQGIVLSSTRDPEFVNAHERLVPCVSCFHPIVSTCRGDRVAVVLNANPVVSSNVKGIVAALSKEHPDVIFATNAMTEFELIDLFQKCKKIITNSYHFTYWSLLSGGDVQVIGYSSKLESLLDLFGMGRNIISRYRKGARQELLLLLRRALRSPYWSAIPEADAARARCRDLNLAFAREAVQRIPSLKISLGQDCIGSDS